MMFGLLSSPTIGSDAVRADECGAREFARLIAGRICRGSSAAAASSVLSFVLRCLGPEGCEEGDGGGGRRAVGGRLMASVWKRPSRCATTASSPSRTRTGTHLATQLAQGMSRGAGEVDESAEVALSGRVM